MSVIEFHIWPEDNPVGIANRLAVITDEDVVLGEDGPAIWYEPSLHGLGGSAGFSISRHSALATSTIIREDNFVRVKVPEISAEYLTFGWWMKSGAFHLIDSDEAGGENITIEGPGLLHKWATGSLWHSSTVFDQPARGSADKESLWWWEDEPYGAILTRAAEEGRHAPYPDPAEVGSPLEFFDITFSRTHDSNAVAWPNIDAEFQVDIGTDLMTVADKLRESGNLYIVGDASDVDALTVHCYQTYGDDLTGAFGAATVRFEKNVNIATELVRRSEAGLRINKLLLRDKDGNYSTETLPGFMAGDVERWGFWDANQTNDDTLLNAIGLNVLAASQTSVEPVGLEVTPGKTPADGLYLPDLHYKPGDTVTLHTGTDPEDYNEADQRVVAVKVSVREGTTDDTSVHAQRSLKIEPQLNFYSPRYGSSNLGTGPMGTPGCRCLKLCRDSGSVAFSEPFEMLMKFRFRMGTVTQRHSIQWILYDVTVGNVRLDWTVDNTLGGGFGNVLGIPSLDLNDEANNNSSAAAANGILSTVDDVWCWVRVRISADEAHARLWKDGSAEPGTWDAETSDGTLTFGDSSANRINRLDVNVRNGTLGSGSSLEIESVEFTDGFAGSSDTESFTRTVASGLGVAEWNGESYYGRTAGLSVNGTQYIDVSTGAVSIWSLDFPAGTETCIHGGPAATAGDDTEAAPGGHEHDYVAAGGATGEVLAKASAADWDTEWIAAGGVDLSAIDFLVGTASGDLSAEIPVGTTPGGELGGTWAAPTVDATHSGSTHDAATNTHIADATDAHDASAVSVLDTAGHFTGTDVETVLDELADSIAAGGIPATIFDAAGDIIVASAADTAARLAAGSEDDVLTIVSGVPAWAAAVGGAGDLVYVAPTTDTAINSTSDVTIVTRNVTGVAAEDQLIVDAWFIILNNSGANRVYNISLDFDGVFPAEMVTASLAVSATIMHQFHLRGVFDVRSTSLTYGLVEIYAGATTGNTDDANMTMVATPLSASVWGTQTTDVTGTVTVAFMIRSANATATQTCRLHNFTVRKVTPT